MLTCHKFARGVLGVRTSKTESGFCCVVRVCCIQLYCKSLLYFVDQLEFLDHLLYIYIHFLDEINEMRFLC